MGTDSEFSGPERTPETFGFAYEELSPADREPVNDGVLFDFGLETYGPV